MLDGGGGKAAEESASQYPSRRDKENGYDLL